jgi:hypothetical protein
LLLRVWLYWWSVCSDDGEIASVVFRRGCPQFTLNLRSDISLVSVRSTSPAAAEASELAAEAVGAYSSSEHGPKEMNMRLRS